MFEEGSTSRNLGYFVPGVGTYLSVEDAVKNPTWGNIGSAALSGLGDVLSVVGVGAGIKGAVAANKAAQIINKGQKIRKAANTATYWNPRQYNSAHHLIKKGLDVAKSAEQAKRFGKVADAAAGLTTIGSKRDKSNLVNRIWNLKNF